MPTLRTTTTTRSIARVPPTTELPQFPATLSGLRVHLRAADFVQADSSAAPASWTDQSGAGRTPAKSGTVTYRTGRTPAGGPAFVFAGAGKYTWGDVWAGMTAATLFVVLKNGASSATENQGPWRIGGGDITFYRYSDGKVYDGAFTSNRTSFTPTLAPESWRVFCITSGAGTYKAYLGNVEQVSAALAFAAPGTGAIIGGGSGANWTGDIAEFVAYDTVLSSGDRTAVYEYLANQHGV
jgi:hypothetical protein